MFKKVILGISVLLIGSMAYGQTALIKSLPEDIDAKEFKNPIFGMWMEEYSRESSRQIITPTWRKLRYTRVGENYMTEPCRILRQSKAAVYMECDFYPVGSFYDPKNPPEGPWLNKKYRLYVSIGHDGVKDKCLIEYRYSSDPEFEHYSSDYLYVEKEDCGPTMTLKD